MLFRRPSLFTDYLRWECFGRALGFGILGALGFAICFWFAPVLNRGDFAIAALALAASGLDALFRHPRFFRDFGLIRELEAFFRKNDFRARLRAELLVWNAQYLINFTVGFIAALGIADYLVGPLGTTAMVRGWLLFSAVFYLANAALWRLATQGRVTAFLLRLKVDFTGRQYG
jgi:hypothetical protein